MARAKGPVPDVLTSAGNLNQPFESLGVVLAVVSRQESGCGGGLPVGQALIDATDDLRRQAHDKGADGVIHISYMHRVSSSAGCGGSTSHFEVYAWGTAIRLL